MPRHGQTGEENGARGITVRGVTEPEKRRDRPSCCLEAPSPRDAETVSAPTPSFLSGESLPRIDLLGTHFHQTTGCNGLPTPFPIGPRC